MAWKQRGDGNGEVASLPFDQSGRENRQINAGGRRVLSVLCRDVLLPGNGVGSRSCERLPSYGLSERKGEKAKHQAARSPHLSGKRLWLCPHLKRVLGDAAAFAQALHHGFVPQDVLLTQVLAPLARLQHQAVHRVEVSQEVAHPLLCDTRVDQGFNWNSPAVKLNSFLCVDHFTNLVRQIFGSYPPFK